MVSDGRTAMCHMCFSFFLLFTFPIPPSSFHQPHALHKRSRFLSVVACLCVCVCACREGPFAWNGLVASLHRHTLQGPHHQRQRRKIPFFSRAKPRLPEMASFRPLLAKAPWFVSPLRSLQQALRLPAHCRGITFDALAKTQSPSAVIGWRCGAASSKSR